MLPSSLQQQLEHMEWADARLWEAILLASQARTDRRTHELLHHVHLVQQLYLQIWRAEPLTISEPASFSDLAALHVWVRRFYASAHDYFASLSPDALQSRVSFPWEAQLVERFGSAHPATLEESVLQIILHTAHHRAQLCVRLRELGGEPPLVDFIAWVWMGKPAAAWPQILAV